MAYTAQQLINMGYPGYRGWGDAEANADFNATHGTGKGGPTSVSSGSGSSSSSNDPAQSLIDLATQNQIKANQAFKDYSNSNPFNYDQVLAQKTTEAKDQLDPYYNENLSDYLLGVTRKTQRSQSDTRDLLSELSSQKNSYERDTQLQLSNAMDKARQGFADAGLFDSGARIREGEGLPTTVAQNSLSDFNRKNTLQTDQANTGLSRTLEDLGSGQRQDVRNLERDRYTNESTLAGQLTKEAGQQYVTGFNQTLPPVLQANNNFDLLKQIGVYS